MQASLSACWAFTSAEEGGYSDAKGDPGNWSGGGVGVGTLVGSNHGVSAPELASWLRRPVTAAEMQALPESTGRGIFTARYFQALRCADLAAGLDLEVSDMAYNGGDGTSGRLLQRVCGLPQADQDGVVGNQTLAAVTAAQGRPAELAAGLPVAEAKALQAALGVVADGQFGPLSQAALAAHPAGGCMALCAALAAEQAAYYRGLADFAEYGDGWLARVASRLAHALQLAGGSAQPA